MPRITRAHVIWTSLPLALVAAVAAIGADAKREPAPAASTSYDLTARRDAGDRTDVVVTLEVGGELLIPRESAEPKKLPMSVAADLVYQEQLLSWSADSSAPTRALRRYSEAKATIKAENQGVDHDLPADRRLIVAELGQEGLTMTGLDGPLTHEQYDLIVKAPATSLALDRLLPNREVSEGDRWDHDAAAIGPLLGMDHVAVCEVRSVVTGEQNGQVQIRLAGTVQGTFEGAPTEMNLRAAYLYHLRLGRITKFNLAIEERREPGDVTPGLDVVAKLSLSSLEPARESKPFDKATLAKAAALDREKLSEVTVDAPQRGYRFAHDAAWFVTSEHREVMALRLVRAGELLAHCNISTHPPRQAPKELAQFEKEVTVALEGKLDEVEAASEWTTARGNRCLGVVAKGAVEGAPIEWRYYQLSAQDRPQITVAVTVEESLVERLADAEKQIIESMELAPIAAKPATETAKTPTKDSTKVK